MKKILAIIALGLLFSGNAYVTQAFAFHLSKGERFGGGTYDILTRENARGERIKEFIKNKSIFIGMNGKDLYSILGGSRNTNILKFGKKNKYVGFSHAYNCNYGHNYWWALEKTTNKGNSYSNYKLTHIWDDPKDFNEHYKNLINNVPSITEKQIKIQSKFLKRFNNEYCSRQYLAFKADKEKKIETTYNGKLGQVNRGMSKIVFCKKEFPAFIGGSCRSISKYFKNRIEVHEYSGRYAIFKNVTIPITGGWNTSGSDIQDWGNGTFYALAFSWTEVETFINEITLAQEKARQKAKQIAKEKSLKKTKKIIAKNSYKYTPPKRNGAQKFLDKIKGN